MGEHALGWRVAAYVAVALLAAVVAYEVLRGRMRAEGFTDGVARDAPAFFARRMPRRYDVVPGQATEEDGYVRNARYAEGYVDVQGLGYEGDFCRVVERPGDPDSRMAACALAGTEGLDSLAFRTDSARAGTAFSRDDYFGRVEGRAAYCRLLPSSGSGSGTSSGATSSSGPSSWEARCIPAGATRFNAGGAEPLDVAPPPEMADRLWFYDGVMAWYRLIDDLVDCAGATRAMVAGGAGVDETPRRDPDGGCEGLRLNAPATAGGAGRTDQFLRLGENAALEFDTRVRLRDLRAVAVWVRFDEFTNNARVFDFGNGPGHDNVWLGIEGRGNAGLGAADRVAGVEEGGAAGLRQFGPALDGGAACAPRVAEVSPQALLALEGPPTDEGTQRPAQEDLVPPPFLGGGGAASSGPAPPRADLVYEVWDGEQRKMRIRVADAVPLGRWTHVVVTTTDTATVRPDYAVYIDGARVLTHHSGHLPLRSYTTRNYVGRSNWEEATAGYAEPDERLHGALFDFRLYAAPLSAARVARTVEWGRRWLRPPEGGWAAFPPPVALPAD